MVVVVVRHNRFLGRVVGALHFGFHRSRNLGLGLGDLLFVVDGNLV